MLLSLSLLLLAIGLFYLTSKVVDDVIRLAVWLSACFCLVLSLLVAPWKSLLLFVVVLLLSPLYFHQNLPRANCPSLSIARKEHPGFLP